MAAKTGFLPWLRPLIFMMIVLALPWLGYEYAYVPKRIEAAKERAFETLVAVSAELGERLVALDRVAETVSGMSDGRTQFLEALLDVKATDEPLAKDAGLERLTVGEGARGGFLLRVLPKDLSSASRPTQLLTVALDFFPEGVVESTFDGIAVLDLNSGRVLARDRRLPGLGVGEVIQFRRDEARVTPAQLLAEANSTPEKAPAERKQGAADRVLHVLTPVERSEQADVHVVLAEREYLAFVQPLRIAVGGLTKDGKPAEVDLVVCAIADESRLTQRAVALSARALTLAIGIVALAILAIPFLKLRFIGRRERMRTYDVWLLGASGLAGTALALLLILYGGARSLLIERFDAGLRAFSEEIERKSSNEAESAVGELRASAVKLFEGPREPKDPIGSILASSTDFATYAPFEAIVFAGVDTQQTRKWMLRVIPTPMVKDPQRYFRDALAIPAAARAPFDVGVGLFGFGSIVAPIDGLELGAFAPSTPTPMVEDRRTSVRDTLALVFGASPPSPAEVGPFAFQSIVARTSGLELAVFALPAHGAASGGRARIGAEVPLGERNGIVAIATQFHSLHKPIVHSPYAFVVLDRERAVTFQSAPGPYRGEKLLDAIEGGSALERGATESGPTSGDYEYHDGIVHMLARDLPAIDSMAIAYYDRAVVESLAAQILGTAAIGGTLIVAAILFGAWLARRTLGDRALDWAWPSPMLLHFHLAGIGVSAVAMVLWFVLKQTVPPAMLLGCVLLLPIMMMLLASAPQSDILAKRLVRRGKLRDWLELHGATSPMYPGVFVVFAIAALGSFVCVPVAIVFQDAFALHALAYERMSDSTFADATRAQSVSLDRSVVNGERKTGARVAAAVTDRLYASPANRKHYLEQRAYFGRYHASADLDASTAPNASVAPLGFASADLALTLAPLGHRPSELLPALDEAREDRLQGNRAAFGWTSLGPRGFGELAVLVFGVILLVVSSSRHVLGLDLVGDGVWPRDDEFISPRSAEVRCWLLLRPGEKDASLHKLRASKDATPFDLREPAHKAANFKPDDPGTGKVLLVDQIACRLDDKDWRTALCELAEQPRKGDLVFVSEIDPFHYVVQMLREAVTVHLPAAASDKERLASVEKAITELGAEVARWATALRSFRKIRFPAREPGDDTRKLFQREHPEDWIREECEERDHSDELREIGAKLREYKHLHRLRRSDVVHFVQDAAEPYYQSLWDVCSRAEKLVMIQLAEEGVVNPKSVELVRRLARRRLVRVDPRYRLMNDSFREFVLTAEPPEQVAEWERVDSAETWSRIGTPLYALGIMLVSIVLLTEPDEVTTVVGVIAAAGSTLAALRGVFGGARLGTPAKPT
jgi:hypothetical protein